MLTFPVDDVTPAAAPLPTRPLGELFPGTLAFGGDPALPVLEQDGVHPLLSAVARAFIDHRPVVLSPDAVWLTIAHGVAQHVRLHAEELRPLLVAHQGRKRLMVEVNGLDDASWGPLVDSFAELLAKEIADADLFGCDFSTSTAVERTAARVVLLDAYSPYFTLWVRSICGIPSVTLTGTVEDWRRIRGRVDALERFGLEQWCRSLRPITDEFVRAAAGAPDVDFWRRIYNPADAYGGDRITGWIARFYPYLASDAVNNPNPLLDLPIDEPRDLTSGPSDIFNGPGIQSVDVPGTVSRVVINVNDRVGGDNHAVALHGGLVAVAQDPGGALRPVAGWYVTPAELELHDVLDRMVREHDTSPAQGLRGEAAVDVVALYHRVGAATLFDGAWRLIPAEEREGVDLGNRALWPETLIELADGRSLLSVLDPELMVNSWALCRVARSETTGLLRLVDDPADVPILGTSLAMLLDAAMDSGGDVAHLETTRLAHLGTTGGLSAP